MADYIPRNEAEKLVWLGRFVDWLVLHGEGHGVDRSRIRRLNSGQVTTGSRKSFPSAEISVSWNFCSFFPRSPRIKH